MESGKPVLLRLYEVSVSIVTQHRPQTKSIQRPGGTADCIVRAVLLTDLCLQDRRINPCVIQLTYT